MKQNIKKRWFWRKKTTRGMPGEPESIWIDIAKRTAKTFAQVALGTITTLLVNPPDKWKPALIMAFSSAACTAMNYFIKRVQNLIGDPDAPDEEPEDETEEGDSE